MSTMCHRGSQPRPARSLAHALCGLEGRGPAGVAAVALVLPILLTQTLHAAIVPTALTGRVTSAGKPLSATTVTATSDELLAPRETVTTANGLYWIADLPPGVYDVTFAHAGMKTLTRRAVVELARVSRSDASLEPSEEEESVTSTAMNVTVADTQMTAHISDGDLDRLPVWRNPEGAAFVAAGAYSATSGTLLDEAWAGTPFLLGQEALEEVTVVRGAAPPELDWFSAIVAKTRSPRDEFAYSLRDTMTSTSWSEGPLEYDEFARRPRGGGVDHFLEAHAGGPALRDRLWFFASAWRGGEDDRALHNVRGYELKLTSLLGASHSIEGEYVDTTYDRRVGFLRAGSQGTLRYDGIVSPVTTIEAVVARSAVTFTPSIYGHGPTALSVDDSVFAKGTHVGSLFAHDSVLSAGVRAAQSTIGGSASLFVNERWSSPMLIVNAGARLDRAAHELHLRPRIGATWDLRRDGRRALFAAFSDYADPRLPDYSVRELTAGYSMALGRSGMIRADVAHRTFARLHERGYDSDILHVESSYRLFERFLAGGFYEYARQDEGAYPFTARYAVNAWASAGLPLGDHELAITLLERYGSFHGPYYATDLGVRYTIPWRSIALTAAADVTNVFNSADFAGGRTFRAWVRVRHS